MNRAAAAAVVAACLSGACAHRNVVGPATRSAAGAHRRPATAATPTSSVPPDAVLAPGAGDGEILLRVARLRAHPLGARVAPFLAAWPGWSDTLQAIAPHPVSDLDWIEVVGPVQPSGERMLARTAAADDATDTRIDALATGSTESARPLVDGDATHAAAARLDGSLRVVVRDEPHLVLASPAAAARALTRALSAARVTDPPGGDDGEILRADLPHPHDALPLLPAEVRRVRAHVDASPGGGADAVAELTCDDEASARRVAAALHAIVDRLDNAVVRLLTHDLLGHVRLDVAGSTVTARLSATRDQLESVLTLAAGMLPRSDEAGAGAGAAGAAPRPGAPR